MRVSALAWHYLYNVMLPAMGVKKAAIKEVTSQSQINFSREIARAAEKSEKADDPSAYYFRAQWLDHFVNSVEFYLQNHYVPGEEWPDPDGLPGQGMVVNNLIRSNPLTGVIHTRNEITVLLPPPFTHAFAELEEEREVRQEQVDDLMRWFKSNIKPVKPR